MLFNRHGKIVKCESSIYKIDLVKCYKKWYGK